MAASVSSWTGPLIVFASCGLLAGIAATAWSAHSAGAVPNGLWDVARRAFAEPAWAAVLVASAAASGAALVLGAIEFALKLRRAPGPPAFETLGSQGVRQALAEIARRVEACTLGERAHVVTALDELVRGAAAVEASDVHISPTPECIRITYRVHGTLHEVTRLPTHLLPLLVTRVKVLAHLDTTVHGVPQDGRLVTTAQGRTLEARVSTLPTDSGERVVLRLVRGSVPVPDLGLLGFSRPVTEALSEILTKPQGLLFVTGPVGSGKTTTLYAAMKHIATTRGKTTNMVTLEDPIELELPFATQTQMNPKSGMTFAGTLRSVLRQDPNVILVGEIRDKETADIAMQAGLTGHLIVTTVHGEGAAGPFARLMDMNIEPFVVASASAGCLAQRLVRTLCTACRRPAAPDPLVLERLARLGAVVPEATYYEPVGCEFCEGEGFSGRTPIGELLVVGPEMRRGIGQRLPTAELHALAVDCGMTPLLRDGLAHAARGETSLGEVLRVAG